MKESKFRELLRWSPLRGSAEASEDIELSCESASKLMNDLLFHITPSQEDFDVTGCTVSYADADRIIFRDSEDMIYMLVSGYDDHSFSVAHPNRITVDVLQASGMLHIVFPPAALIEYYRLEADVLNAAQEACEDAERSEYLRLKKKFEGSAN